MNEGKMNEIFEGLSQEGINLLEQFFNDVDDTNNVDGLQLLGALFSLKDSDFELLRPLIQDSMVQSFNEPQTQMQLMKMLGQSGISINDILNKTDQVIEQLFKDDNFKDLSDSKKDLFKFMFSAMENAISHSTINPAHIVDIPVIICRENAKLPTYATNGSGAMDIYSPEEVTLTPGECIIIPIGIKVSIPHGYGLLIQPRSGLSRKIKLRIPNTPGLIDEDYHEEIGVIVENIDTPLKDVAVLDNGENANLYGSSITIGKGERFAQMRLVEIPRVKWCEVKSFGGFNDEEDHGKGFGSTGTN